MFGFQKAMENSIWIWKFIKLSAQCASNFAIKSKIWDFIKRNVQAEAKLRDNKNKRECNQYRKREVNF